MLDALHQTLVASGLFEAGHIKLRAMPLTHYRLGGARQHFLHAQLRIHRGRSEEQKQKLSRRVLETLRGQQWPLQVITVEVVEMDRASYAKFSAPLGNI